MRVSGDNVQDSRGLYRGTILYVLTRFPVVTETFILNELREMRRQGIRYHLFAFRLDREMAARPPYNEISATELPRPWAPEVIRANGCIWADSWPLVYRLLCSRACRKLHHFFQAVYLADWVKRHDISHIHAHYAYQSTSAARVAACLAGIGYSFTAHANDIYKSDWKIREKIADAAFCVTCTGYNARYLREHYAQSCPDKIFKIYHGIDFKQFSPGSDRARRTGRSIRILSVGRLREKKGFPFLIEACSLLIDQGLSVKATIVGEGRDRRDLEAMIVKKGLEDVVTLTGAIPHSEVARLLEDADIFVLPCIIASDRSRDGIPNVILEAMAMRLPVISTTVSAIPEAVEHGKTGILVPPGDAPALAGAISRLANSPDECIKMGDAGRKKVMEKFDLGSNTRSLISLFKEALRPRP